MIDYEHQEQVAVFDAIEHIYGPIYPELELLYATPNGGKRDKRTAGKLKAEGVKPGIPDLFLPVARGGYHGLYVEMKAIYPDGKAGSMSKDQKAWKERLERQGYAHIVCYSWLEAIDSMIQYLSLEDEPCSSAAPNQAG